MEKRHETLISYYQGAYGSTLRIDVQDKKWLELFRRCVLLLVTGDMDEIKIDCFDNVRCVDVKSFTLIKAQHMRYLKISVTKNGFSWVQNEEELITLIGLIDGLLACDTSGHQYLTGEDDGILIVLAYKEQ